MAKNLVRFDPFADVARFDPFGGFEDFFKNFSLQPVMRGMDAEPLIKMDVSETDQAYTIKAEMPGLKKEDIKVDVNGNQVSISAEIKKEKEEKEGEKVIRSERYYGQQYRSFTLAQEVDDAKADAKYQDGVLVLSLPKKPGAEHKKLAVH